MPSGQSSWQRPRRRDSSPSPFDPGWRADPGRTSQVIPTPVSCCSQWASPPFNPSPPGRPCRAGLRQWVRIADQRRGEDAVARNRAKARLPPPPVACDKQSGHARVNQRSQREHHAVGQTAFSHGEDSGDAEAGPRNDPNRTAPKSPPATLGPIAGPTTATTGMARIVGSGSSIVHTRNQAAKSGCGPRHHLDTSGILHSVRHTKRTLPGGLDGRTQAARLPRWPTLSRTLARRNHECRRSDTEKSNRRLPQESTHEMPAWFMSTTLPALPPPEYGQGNAPAYAIVGEHGGDGRCYIEGTCQRPDNEVARSNTGRQTQG